MHTFFYNLILDSFHTYLHLLALWFLLLFSAAIVSLGKCGPVTELTTFLLSPRCSPSSYMASSQVRVLPISLDPSRRSHLTLLKRWPSSSDMQSNSQCPCSASSSPQTIAMGVFCFLGGTRYNPSKPSGFKHIQVYFSTSSQSHSGLLLYQDLNLHTLMTAKAINIS